jgi:hypothetical protein
MLPYYRKGLLTLFGRVRNLADSEPYNALEYAAIQELLIKRIVYVEGRIQAAKASIKELNFALTQRLPKVESALVKQRIENSKERIREYDNLLHIYRTIGDALIFLNIPRWEIPPLVSSPSAGFVSGKKGLGAERAALKAYTSAGIPAVLNDLTNVMRHVDITIIYKDAFRLAEIKSGGYEKARIERQIAAARRVWNFLVSGQGVGDPHHPGLRIVRALYHSQEQDNVGALNALLFEAKRIGHALGEVETGLWYLVTGWDSSQALALLDHAIHSTATPMTFHIFTAKFRVFGYYPFTLSIHDPEVLYDFYNGDLVITVILDQARVIELAARQGVEVVFTNDAEYPLEMRTNEQAKAGGDYRMKVGRHFVGRLGCEFLSLEWFVDELVYRINNAPSKGQSITDPSTGS